MPTDSKGSITRLVGGLGGADAEEAARRLWDLYFDRIVELARSRLRSAARGAADEEDVALSAFDSLCRGVAAGRFPRLEGRDDLWRILATITVRKVADQIERERRLKRGAGRVVRGTDLNPSEGDAGDALGQLAGSAPTPAFLAMMGEQIRHLFGLLPDETLRVVALMRMEGFSNEEIARSFDCAVRSVERKLERIRALWDAEVTSA